MKKKIIVVLICIMAFSVTACGGAKQNEPSTTSESPAKTTEESMAEPTVETDSKQEQNTNKDFRNATWGMTMDEVIESEGKDPDLQDKEMVGYHDVKLGTISTLLYYKFEDNSLYAGLYLSDEVHTNTLKYLDDYNSMKDLYIEKYSEPSKDEVVWSDKTFSDDIAYSLMFGYVEYFTVFTENNTNILFHMNGDNGDVSFSITYIDSGYKATPDTSGI